MSEKQKTDLSGLIPESHNCVDCGYNTQPGWLNRFEAEQSIAKQRAAGIKKWALDIELTWNDETYIVYDHVWKAAGMKGEWGDGVLCIGCLEKRLGRKLTPYDFPTNHPYNMLKLPGTQRRLERLTGKPLLGKLGDYQEPVVSKLDQAFRAARGGKQWDPGEAGG
jgi:hypothetical protein